MEEKESAWQISVNSHQTLSSSQGSGNNWTEDFLVVRSLPVVATAIEPSVEVATSRAQRGLSISGPLVDVVVDTVGVGSIGGDAGNDGGVGVDGGGGVGGVGGSCRCRCQSEEGCPRWRWGWRCR